MSPERSKRMRKDILSLSRADLRDLARASGLSRDDLTDFAEIGGDLPLDAMTALDAWYEIHETRTLFSRPHISGLISSLHDATGINLFERQAFVQGETDLTVEQRAAIRRHMTGKPDYVPPPVAVLATAYPSQPADIALRGEAVRIINRMSPADLRAFVDASRPA